MNHLHRPLALALLLILSPISCAQASAQAPAQAPGQGEVESVQEEFMNTGVTSGETVEVPAEVVDPHPAFLANRTVRVEGTVGDLFAAGEKVQIPGVVDGNAFVACRTARVSGVVAGDLFFFGETVTIEGEVQGDLYGFFQEVRILENGAVRGDVHAGGESMWIGGEVGGRIAGGCRRLDILGSVDGDVLVACEELSVHENARIGGRLRYDSPSEPVIREGAVVVGEIKRVTYDDGRDRNRESRRGGGGGGGSFLSAVVWKLILFLSTLIAGLIYLSLGSPAVSRPAQLLAERPVAGLGIGLVTLLSTSLVATFSCFLPPLMVVLFLTLALATFLARVVTAECAGSWLLGKMGKASPSRYVSFIVGLVVFYLLTSIPILGGLVWIGWVLSGLGGLALALGQARKAVANT